MKVQENVNTVILQEWEESERGWGVRPDGCSIHLTNEDLNDYIKYVYDTRNTDYIPDEYDRISGEPNRVSISDEIMEDLKKEKTLRLSRVSYYNMKKLGKIVILGY